MGKWPKSLVGALLAGVISWPGCESCHTCSGPKTTSAPPTYRPAPAGYGNYGPGSAGAVSPYSATRSSPAGNPGTATPGTVTPARQLPPVTSGSPRSVPDTAMPVQPTAAPDGDKTDYVPPPLPPPARESRFTPKEAPAVGVPSSSKSGDSLTPASSHAPSPSSSSDSQMPIPTSPTPTGSDQTDSSSVPTVPPPPTPPSLNP